MRLFKVGLLSARDLSVGWTRRRAASGQGRQDDERGYRARRVYQVRLQRGGVGEAVAGVIDKNTSVRQSGWERYSSLSMASSSATLRW
jgi:hypothetical protein